MAQEPGSTQPLTPSEVEQAFASAPFKNKGPALLHASEERVNWKDSNGKLHRDGDLPAVVWGDGSQFWWRHGELHRDGDLPAVIWRSGVQAWYQHGEEHRDGDLPSRVRPGGDQEWRQHGKLHRDNNLPAVIKTDGRMFWYEHNELIGNQDNPPPGAVFPGQQTKSASKR